MTQAKFEVNFQTTMSTLHWLRDKQQTTVCIRT